MDLPVSSASESLALPRPTLKTIAFMTGLGITTVSRALKDAPEIGVETRRRVQLVAAQVGYRPNRAGVRLRTGKTNVISLVLNTDDRVGGFLSDIIYGISEVLAPTPYHLIVTPYSSSNDPMAPVRYVVETGSADGIILSRTQPEDPRVRFLTERRFSFATHGRTRMGIEHPFHDYDNAFFAKQAVATLVGLRRRRLALLGPPPSLTYAQHTREGFLRGLSESEAAEAGFGGTHIDEGMEVIRSRTRVLMSRKDRPDGVISSAGAATLALVAGIEDAGLTLGREVDLVSKESTPILKLFRPAICVVPENFRHAGRELAHAVLGSIAQQPVSTLQSLIGPSEEA